MAANIPDVSGNGCVLVLTTMYEQLQTNHYHLLCVNAANDVLLSVAYVVCIAIVLARPDAVLTIRAVSCLAISLSGIQIYMAVVIAAERYVFFKVPLKYDAIMSRRSIAVTLGVVYVAVLTFNVVTDVLVGRAVSVTCMCTQFKQSGGAMSVIGVFVYVLPSLVFTAVFAVLLMIHVRQKQRTAPAGSALEAVATGHASVIANTKIAVRLILLISGALWLTTVPASLLRSAIFSTGLTWSDLETREGHGAAAAAVALRGALVMYATGSSALNPLVYFYTDPSLREAARRLWGRLRGDCRVWPQPAGIGHNVLSNQRDGSDP